MKKDMPFVCLIMFYSIYGVCENYMHNAMLMFIQNYHRTHSTQCTLYVYVYTHFKLMFHNKYYYCVL